jgi:prepilin-type N-terminal cleavage/methylation domain-containing protein
MKKINNNKGFTLIELLVVIAIIGILASVILASLDTARAKGADAASKEDLDNARPQAELFYDGNSNSYLGVCAAAVSATPGGILGMVTDAGSKSGKAYVAGAGTAGTLSNTVCHDSAGAWAAEVPLLSTANSFFCVDSTGATKITTNVLAASTYVCS